MKKEEKRESLAGVIASVAFLIFAIGLTGMVIHSVIKDVYVWWNAPEQVGIERFSEISYICAELGFDVQWIEGTDGLYQDVRCKGE